MTPTPASINPPITPQPRMLLPGLAAAARLAVFAAGGAWRRAGRRPAGPHAVPEGFLGICAAGAADPAGDDYILERLNELGIRQVRLDLTYPAEDGCQPRLLEKLLQHDFKVCLHLVQPRAEARLMSRNGPSAAAAAERWRAFVDATLARWGGAAGAVEVGATCNRRKWSGQTLAAFAQSWQIAWTIARARGVTIIGPNVTDFEPAYNFLLLDRLLRLGCPPDAHTDNLFVERATEPENYDHKILGRRAAGWLRCNLIRKARLLQAVGAVNGTPVFICSHTAWSLRRIARYLDHVEEKQADYLARYLLLAASAGALERVYWGPLIGQREGLIDDGTDEYPDPPHVTLYPQSRGKPADYRVRPAFHAMAAVQKLLQDAVFEKPHTPGPELEILEFKGPDGAIRHAAWTVNGRCAASAACYHPSALASAACADRDGRRLAAPPAFFGESPTYLTWQRPPPTLLLPKPAPAAWRLDWHRHRADGHAPLRAAAWRGIYQTRAENGAAIDPAALLDAAAPNENALVLRAGRNRVWRVPAPWSSKSYIVIKQFKIPGLWRRCLDWRKPSKAMRSWNGAQELLRRGLPTPTPLAGLLSSQKGKPEFYICADFQPDYSARDIFTGLAGNAHLEPDMSPADWYASISVFLARMHDRGVYFRDLSAGNLLLRRCPGGGLFEYSLIDTARARFYPWPLPLRQRLADLKRICHPLTWPGRRALITFYMRAIGRPFRNWMLLPLLAYDWKHRLKHAVKPLRRKMGAL